MLEQDFLKVCERISSSLDAHRLAHTLGVVGSAAELAKRYGADENKARMAAMLHDLAKHYSKDEYIAYAVKNGIHMDEYALEHPKILHGPIAAHIAKNELNIYDEDIQSAIACHTLGKADMSILDKIIYLADAIEENRDYEGLEDVRALSKESLNRACLMAMDIFSKMNVDKGITVHPDTLRARESLIEDINREEKI